MHDAPVTDKYATGRHGYGYLIGAYGSPVRLCMARIVRPSM
jgi:hypothetical protein